MKIGHGLMGLLFGVGYFEPVGLLCLLILYILHASSTRDEIPQDIFDKGVDGLEMLPNQIALCFFISSLAHASSSLFRQSTSVHFHDTSDGH